MTDSDHRARHYARIRYRLRLVNLSLTWFFLAMFFASGFANVVKAAAESLSSVPIFQIAVFLVILGLFTYCFLLPLSLYGSFFLEHRFGLSRMSFRDWCVREFKSLLVGGALMGVAVCGFYAIVAAVPYAWPFWVTLAWVCFSILLAKIFPTLLLPIFFKTEPLPDQALAQRLSKLCAEAGIKALGVYRFRMGAETRKANAALAGLGTTRRVLLADTLIDEFTPDEIEGVLAHELAHHQFGHIRKSLFLGALATLMAMLLTQQSWLFFAPQLGLSGLTDPAGMSLLALWFSVLQFFFMPVQNGISRLFEWEADHFASEKCASPAAFASALERLAQINLADPNPPKWVEWWFHDHPPISHRIRSAHAYAAARA